MTNDLLYSLFPVWLQNIVCRYYSHRMSRLRYNDDFYKALEFLRGSESWSHDRIQEYKEEQFLRTAAYAFHTVPYYKELFEDHHLTLSDLKSLDDIYKIPILTKDIYRKNIDRLISTEVDKRDIYWGRTSGSTGKALQYGLSKNMVAFQWAVWWRFRERFGLHYGDKHLNFVGSKLIVPKEQRHPPFWRYFKEQNQYIINMYQLKKEKISDIVNFIDDENFVFFSGYPSCIYQFAALVKESALYLKNPPKIVLTGAEKLREHQRALISKVCRCRVLDHYGFSEAAANASCCEHGFYHEDFEMGLMEPYHPKTLPDGSVEGEILATSFLNNAIPLLRYKVGDIAIWSKGQCRCGRASRVIKSIEGRMEDVIVTPEGLRISRVDAIWEDTDNVVEAQVVQDKTDHIVLRIVKGENYASKDELHILKNAEIVLSPRLNVDIEYINSEQIEKTSRGKFKAVISRLN